ncbi:MAG: adenylosuccinate synthetase [Nanoarchaeota archaeon]|nr:adenylosuccinate synthetase [Nanoarchaeota archaeon]
MVQILEGYVCLYWGDSGKGKLVDEAVERAQQQSDRKRTVVVRFQGGPNAGHSMYVRNSKGILVPFITHAAPSGLVSRADIAVGPQVAFDPEKFLNELNEVRDLFDYDGRIMVSERAGVLMDYHRQLDAWQESLRTNKIGTTLSGMGPFYMDNARRDTRITFADYVSDKFHEKLASVLDLKQLELSAAGISPIDYFDELIALHKPIRKELKPFAERLEYRMQEYLEKGNHIIIEGAQGTGLHVDMGTIDDVTSSHLLMSEGLASLGLPRKAFKIVGVEKIYPTRVGNGPMPTLDRGLEEMGENAGEYGATTKRRRREGWPDLVFVRRSAFLNDCDRIALTRADCLQDIEVKVCTAYLVNETFTEEVPFYLKDAKSIYNEETFKWHLWDGPRDISDPKLVDDELKSKRAAYIEQGFESLPTGLKDFVKFHNIFVGVPIDRVSIGPARGETVQTNYH